MDGSIFFVHGTGNWDGRRPGINTQLATTLDAIRRGLARSKMSTITVDGPPWARDLAADWPDISQVLPQASATRTKRAIGENGEPTDDADTWELLLQDPLIELRLVGLGAQAESAPRVGGLLPAQIVSELTRRLTLADADLANTGVDQAHLKAATRLVADSEELEAAAEAINEPANSELLDTVTRAVVAQMLVSYRDDPDVPAPVALLSGDARSDLVTAVRAALATGTYKALVPKRAQRAAAALAARVGTRWAVARRDALMDPVTAFLADIAFYLQHGQELRNYVRARIDSLPPPHVLLGHSLGGVALVDLMSGDDRPEADLLITVGSQAPYLYLVDALANLRPPHPERRPFAPWLNIYNRRDLLSFCAMPVFAGVGGVEDVAVDPGVPFPESHSAYWDAPATWEAVSQKWPQP
jgi:hypothetical protein